MADETTATTEIEADDEEYGVVSSKDDLPFVMPMEEFPELPEGGIQEPVPLVKFTVYNNETGRVTQFGECAADELEFQDQDEPHLTVIEGVYHFDDYYVDLATHEPREKQNYLYRLETTPLTLTIIGLPAGTKLAVAGMALVTDEEATEIDFDVPGTHEISLSGLVSHHNTSFEVTIDG